MNWDFSDEFTVDDHCEYCGEPEPECICDDDDDDEHDDGPWCEECYIVGGRHDPDCSQYPEPLITKTPGVEVEERIVDQQFVTATPKDALRTLWRVALSVGLPSTNIDGFSVTATYKSTGPHAGKLMSLAVTYPRDTFDVWPSREGNILIRRMDDDHLDNSIIYLRDKAQRTARNQKFLARMQEEQQRRAALPSTEEGLVLDTLTIVLPGATDPEAEADACTT